MKICYQCRIEVFVAERVGRSETCPSCDADLRCCLNCRFYDPVAYNQCCENQADRVLEKDKGNFCEYFLFKDSTDAARDVSGKQKAKNPLDGIFKK